VADTNHFNLNELDQFEPDLFWQQHGKKIIAGTIAALVIGLGVYFWQQQKEDDKNRASTRLAEATTPADLEKVAKDFADTDMAPAALLRLADLYFREARYPDATKALQEIVNKYPQHLLADGARLGLAAVQEAVGNYEAARTLYGQLVSTSPNSYTVLPARLGAARCEELLGKTREARQLYNEVLAADQSTGWQGEAFFRWTVLGRQLPVSPLPPVNKSEINTR
jgi:predicted negative regulator of RcsB-dependent stress response